MTRISYTLLSDGSSDKMIMPILEWLLLLHCPNYAFEPQWADLGRLPRPPKKLLDRIKKTAELYKSDLLFIHRDAENQSFELRHREITSALAGFGTEPPAICVIPIRMQEAWLLFSEEAIRRAAGNPNGRIPLQLPATNAIETIPNPKEVLFSLIRSASGLSGTRLKKLNPQKCAHLVSKFLDDFTPLRAHSAFRSLESELIRVVQNKGWCEQ